MIRSDLLIVIISSISIVDSLNCLKNVNFTSICSDDSMTGSIVYLSGVPLQETPTHCSCSLSTGIPTNVTIKTVRILHGCKYKFQFIYMTDSWDYSCTQAYVPTISMTGGSLLKINVLQVDQNIPDKDFQICLQIGSGSPLTLSCGKSSYKPNIETSFTENITPPGDESNQPTSSSEPNQLTSDSESNQPTMPTSKNDNSMSGIIGGSVGGLVVIIVIIIIVICVIRKRRKEKTYESPEAAETDAHPYQNIPDNRSGEITHPYQNIPDNRRGEITHQPKQNNEVVLQENDPYTNINNDIIKPSNGIQGIEYLENDLYICSDDVTDDDKLRDKYAVVTKGGKMIKNEAGNQFKIGPSGDQYTVVSKTGGGNTNN